MQAGSFTRQAMAAVVTDVTINFTVTKLTYIIAAVMRTRTRLKCLFLWSFPNEHALEP